MSLFQKVALAPFRFELISHVQAVKWALFSLNGNPVKPKFRVFFSYR